MPWHYFDPFKLKVSCTECTVGKLQGNEQCKVRKLLCTTAMQWEVFIKLLSISADIKSIKEVLNLSGADLQRLMKLSSADVECLLKTVSRTLRKNCMLTGNKVSVLKKHSM